MQHTSGLNSKVYLTSVAKRILAVSKTRLYNFYQFRIREKIDVTSENDKSMYYEIYSQ